MRNLPIIILSFFLLAFSFMDCHATPVDTEIDIAPSVGVNEFNVPMLLTNCNRSAAIIWLSKDPETNKMALYASKLIYKNLWTCAERISDKEESVLPGFKALLNPEGQIFIIYRAQVGDARHSFSISGNINGEWSKKEKIS